ncbi:MAG: autotransporter domain-containing protein, partial [Chthoniobacterales bacterium]|nr:autotransporter domain-containing protein [Chthoniobacterales bacterium]
MNAALDSYCDLSCLDAFSSVSKYSQARSYRPSKFSRYYQYEIHWLVLLIIVISQLFVSHVIAQENNLYVGSNSSGQATNFTNGIYSYDNTYVGYAGGASNNSLSIINAGTQLTNSSNITIGVEGASNLMTISSGGKVVNSNGVIGSSNSSSNNSVLVTDSRSLWSNNSDLAIGLNGASNLMMISSGGIVVNSNGVIGSSNSSSNNSVLVTDSLSLWSNKGNLIIGLNGASNLMTISSGGRVVNSNGVIGYSSSSSNNSVLVTDSRSLWSNKGNLIIGLNGANNTLTIANGGTVSASSGVIIGGNGILKGNGTLNASVTNNGLLAPGYPTGTFTINGNVTQSSSGTLQIKVVSSNIYGQLQVNGSVTLAGTLEITPVLGSSLSYGERLTFLNSSGPIKGSFDTVQVDEPYCRGRVQIIGDPQAIVTIAPTSYTYLAQNQNQTNVATALDSFIPATSGDELLVATGLDSLTAAQYPAALNAIMPILYQSLSTIAFNIDNAQNQELIQRLWGVRLAGASEYGGSFSMSGLAENTPMLQAPKSGGDKEVKEDILRPAPDNHWGIFVDGNGIFAQANSANLLSTYNAESGGVTTGLSYRWNKQVSTGLYTGYQGVYTKYSGGSTLVDNQVNFGLFGTYGQENGEGLFIDALAGGAYDNYQMNRTISFRTGENALNRTAMGTPGAGELNTMVATAYDL